MDVAQEVKKLPFKDIFVLYSNNKNIRYGGTSGGFVTELNKFLFDAGKIKSSVSYMFKGLELYKPFIIYGSEELIQVGSIYHDVNLLGFLKANIDKLNSPIYIICLPCQCKAIRKLMDLYGIKSIIVSLVCSVQLKKEATYDFLKRQNIDINSVKKLQYRGGGWPSGMQIVKKDGESYFFKNSGSEWNMFFHSTIYNMERCFYCKDTFGSNADFSVSDPWIERYYKKDNIGHSIVAVNSHQAVHILKDMLNNDRIKVVEEISKKEFFNSQIFAVQIKKAYGHSFFYKKFINFFRTPIYKNFFNKFPKVHDKMHKILRYYFIKWV